jgi:hypothetical protein
MGFHAIDNERMILGEHVRLSRRTHRLLATLMTRN